MKEGKLNEKEKRKIKLTTEERKENKEYEKKSLYSCACVSGKVKKKNNWNKKMKLK